MKQPSSMSMPPFCGGGLRTTLTPIAMLGGVVVLLVDTPKSNRLKDRGQTFLRCSDVNPCH